MAIFDEIVNVWIAFNRVDEIKRCRIVIKNFGMPRRRMWQTKTQPHRQLHLATLQKAIFSEISFSHLNQIKLYRYAWIKTKVSWIDSSEPFNLPANPVSRAPMPECDNSILKRMTRNAIFCINRHFREPFCERDAPKEFLITIEIEITQDTKSRAAESMQPSSTWRVLNLKTHSSRIEKFQV